MNSLPPPPRFRDSLRAARVWRKLRKTVLPGILTWCGLTGMAAGQELQLRPLNLNAEERALDPATEYRPERVRILLMSIHGFTLAALNAASTDVAAILAGFIDGGELMVVRRQAVKALRWFPSAEMLTFIEERVYTAPAGLKHLYLQSLGGFAAVAPERTTTVMAAMIDDADVTVRYAALHLSRALQSGPAVRAVLEGRLERESHRGLRQAIEERLDKP